MKNPVFLVCHIINFLVNCLIQYNSQQKYYQKYGYQKFMKLKKESYVFIYQIKEIITNFEENKGQFDKFTFKEYFDQYLEHFKTDAFSKIQG